MTLAPEQHQNNVFALDSMRRASGPPSEGADSVPAFTDKGNGERLARRHGKELRYCGDWKRWLVWDERRWRFDTDGEVMRRAKETVEAMPREGVNIGDTKKVEELHKHAARSQSWMSLRNMTNCAQSELGIAANPDQFDTQPFLLNALNGTINLRTGEMCPARHEDHITKLAPVEYDTHAECPEWDTFLYRIQKEDPNMVAFLQRAVGYSMTGDVRERVLFILFGPGANGKSTFLQTLREMLGEYATRAPAETLLAKRDSSIPADIAKLKGARFVTASETEEGRKLADATIKDLTGNETIAARFLHANWFEFKPECKFWLGTNHKPPTRSGGQALFDRLRLVPFAVRIAEKDQDKELGAKLLRELPGILNWAIAGCLEWQREGLGVPGLVSSATKDYQNDVDPFGAFLEDCCQQGIGLKVPHADLFKEYDRWRLENHESELKSMTLSLKLSDRVFVKHKSGSVRWWEGLALKYRQSDAATDNDTTDF